MNHGNISTRKRIYRKHENKQYSKKYLQEDNISIDILNDCLEHILKFLPIADRLCLERGEYSLCTSLHMYFASHTLLKIDIVFFGSCTYIYIFYYYSLQTLECSEQKIVALNEET